MSLVGVCWTVSDTDSTVLVCSGVLLVQNREVLGEVLARYFMRQLLEALVYLHANGICHRDVKCENVLLFQRRQVAKLADFGFARAYSTLDLPLSTYHGSVAYSAPELLSATPYDPRTADLWSLACIFYIMVCYLHLCNVIYLLT